MVFRLILIVALLAAAVPAAAQQHGAGSGTAPSFGGTYRALVIGNDDYRDPRGLWKPLKTAVNDARAVAEVLRSTYGFSDVKLLENATRRQMIQAFNGLAERSRKNDSVVIYYAGHGYLREATREGFWIPVDAEGQDDSTFVPNTTVKTKVGIIADRARHVFLISDSCFSGALLAEGNRGIRVEQRGEGYYRRAERRKSVQLLAAGGLEFVDDNYRGTGHSPFTYYLLQELRDPGTSPLEATGLSARVVRNVSINVEQKPVSGVMRGVGHAGGEFFFYKGGRALASREGFTAPASTGPNGRQVTAVRVPQPLPPLRAAGRRYRVYVAVQDFVDGKPFDQQISAGALEALLLDARHRVVGSAGARALTEQQALKEARRRKAELLIIGRADARFSRQLKIADTYTAYFYDSFLQVRTIRVDSGEVVHSQRFDTLNAKGADTSALGKVISAVKSLKHVVNSHGDQIAAALERTP